MEEKRAGQEDEQNCLNIHVIVCLEMSAFSIIGGGQGSPTGCVFVKNERKLFNLVLLEADI